jgi:hypothetical protein
MTKQETTYQGWTNYETWNVNLWLVNEQSDLERWQGRAKAMLETHGPRKAVSVLAQLLEAHYDEEAYSWIDDQPPCCFSDLLLASLRQVNWREIAERVLEDVQVES